ncbi:MAG: AbrB/MazE/SpoVT family DNA-binding domain-containing protein [Patescibacteria group bacterium]
MTQKVLKVGTSAAVTIPKQSLKDLGLKIGDRVRVEIDIKEKRVLIESAHKINPEILDWSSRFIKQYRVALEALAKK